MIERNIFQTWKSKTTVPPHFQYWRDTVIDQNPGFTQFFWDDGDNRRFIAANYPWFLPVYDEYPAEIYRADAVRYFWLYHFGGVYIDLDSECLKPLQPLCDAQGGVVLGRMGSDPGFVHSIPNAVMMSSRREPFWLYVVHLMMGAQPARNHPEDLTGSIVLKAAVDAFQGRAADAGIDAAIGAVAARLPPALRPAAARSAIRILPPECFYPVNWADPIHQVFFRRRIFKDGSVLPRDKAVALFPHSYIATYWAHSWDYDEAWDGR